MGIGASGFWFLTEDREYFVPFDDYPAFKSATVEQIFDVRQIGAEQLHWPDLDVDIELPALDDPSRFPLRWR
jgi:hypothetical protein